MTSTPREDHVSSTPRLKTLLACAASALAATATLGMGATAPAAGQATTQANVSDFLARQLSLPATCQKDYLRLRSRIFRFSYAKYTNSAFWNPEANPGLIVLGALALASAPRAGQEQRLSARRTSCSLQSL